MIQIIPSLEPEFVELEKKFRERWTKIGYPKSLQDKAIKRARRWLTGLVAIWDEIKQPELALEWEKENLPYSFVHSEAWMDEIIEAFSPEKGEELKRRKAELKLEEIV